MLPEPVASGIVKTTFAFPPTSPSKSVLPACSDSVIESVAVIVCIALLKDPVKVTCEAVVTAPVPFVTKVKSEFVAT